MNLDTVPGSKIERIGALDAGGKLTENINILVGALQDSTRDATWFTQRANLCYEQRYNYWAGQSTDGRKHGEDIGHPAFPWEGASDMRPRSIDALVNEQVMLMLQAFTRSQTQGVGLHTGDVAYGEQVSTFLRYLIWNRMRDQARRELSLAANYRQTYGSAVISVMWDQQMRRTEQQITIEGLATLLAESTDPQVLQQSGLVVQQMIVDPSREEENIQLLQGLSSILTKPAARKALKELREAGSTTIPVPEIYAAMPRWQALLPQVDVYFPVLTDDLQRAAWVAQREILTESELRDRIMTHGYDKDWVEEAIKKKGNFLDTLNSSLLMQSEMRRNYFGIANNAKKDLIEIYHVFRRSIDDQGLPVVWNTVMSPAIKDLVAFDEPLPYEHGQYPFIVLQRETLARTILESRGVPEIADTWQREIKTQRDARTDRTNISVLPPIMVPPSRGGNTLPFGPGVRWPSRRGDEISWLPIPPEDGSSIEIEKASQATLDVYFGRISELCPPQLQQLHAQDLVDGWLLELRGVITQTLQLCQQFMTDDQVTKIVGPLTQPWKLDRDAIEHQYLITLEFDTRDLNADLLKSKLELLQGFIIPNDQFGRIDHSKMVELMLRSVDPNMASQILTPMDQANSAQVSDEQQVLSQMITGIEPQNQPQNGMNYQLRLQTLQHSIQSNPEIQQAIASRQILAQMVQNRMKFLQFQITQGDNAQIGRVGTAPVLQGPEPKPQQLLQQALQPAPQAQQPLQ